MNTRIFELAELALEETHRVMGSTSLQEAFDDFYTEKFAELIVRECMEQVWYSREDGINGNVSEVIKDRIKQHFGVE